MLLKKAVIAGCFAVLLCLCLSEALLLAHQDQKHRSSNGEGHPAPSIHGLDEKTLAPIQKSYQTRVQPIFEKKCLQCHGGEPTLPWYYNMPGVRQLMDRDMKESKEHLDFSKGYPFGSHATPREDLQSIRKSAAEGSMPPFLYLIGHPGHRLSGEEKRIVMDWADEGMGLLQKGAKP